MSAGQTVNEETVGALKTRAASSKKKNPQLPAEGIARQFYGLDRTPVPEVQIVDEFSLIPA